jgi:hypothetical protein
MRHVHPYTYTISLSLSNICMHIIYQGLNTDTRCVLSVTYQGYSYAALDVAATPDSTATYCHDTYLTLPAGWSIAPDNAASISVISSYTWGTHLMVLSNGAQYYTSHPDYQSQAGQARTWIPSADMPTALGTSGSRYKVNECARRILLKYTTGIVSPTLCGPPVALPCRES